MAYGCCQLHDPTLISKKKERWRERERRDKSRNEGEREEKRIQQQSVGASCHRTRDHQ